MITIGAKSIDKYNYNRVSIVVMEKKNIKNVCRNTLLKFGLIQQNSEMDAGRWWIAVGAWWSTPLLGCWAYQPWGFLPCSSVVIKQVGFAGVLSLGTLGDSFLFLLHATEKHYSTQRRNFRFCLRGSASPPPPL